MHVCCDNGSPSVDCRLDGTRRNDLARRTTTRSTWSQSLRTGDKTWILGIVGSSHLQLISWRVSLSVSLSFGSS